VDLEGSKKKAVRAALEVHSPSGGAGLPRAGSGGRGRQEATVYAQAWERTTVLPVSETGAAPDPRDSSSHPNQSLPFKWQ
jgi:hypothetical protein